MHAHRPNSYVWTDVTVTVRIIIKNKTSMIIKSLFLRIRFYKYVLLRCTTIWVIYVLRPFTRIRVLSSLISEGYLSCEFHPCVMKYILPQKKTKDTSS